VGDTPVLGRLWEPRALTPDTPARLLAAGPVLRVIAFDDCG
jgi:hypothetical protein